MSSATRITPLQARHNPRPVQHHVRSLLYPFEPLPPYTPCARDPDTVISRAPSYVSAAPSYHTIDPGQPEDDSAEGSGDSDDTISHNDSTGTIIDVTFDGASGLNIIRNDYGDDPSRAHRHDASIDSAVEPSPTQARGSPHGTLQNAGGRFDSSEPKTAAPRPEASTPTPAVDHGGDVASPRTTGSTSSTETQAVRTGNSGQRSSPSLLSPSAPTRGNRLEALNPKPAVNREPGRPSQRPSTSSSPIGSHGSRTGNNSHSNSPELPSARSLAPSSKPAVNREPVRPLTRPSAASPSSTPTNRTGSSSPRNSPLLPSSRSLAPSPSPAVNRELGRPLNRPSAASSSSTPTVRNGASSPSNSPPLPSSVSFTPFPKPAGNRELGRPLHRPSVSLSSTPTHMLRTGNNSQSNSPAMSSTSSFARSNDYNKSQLPLNQNGSSPAAVRGSQQTQNVGRRRATATNTRANNTAPAPAPVTGDKRDTPNRARSRSLLDIFSSAKPRLNKATESPPRPSSARVNHSRNANLSRSLMPLSHSEMNLSRVPKATGPKPNQTPAIEDSTLVGKTAAERNQSQRKYRTNEGERDSLYFAVPVDLSMANPATSPTSSNAGRNNSDNTRRPQNGEANARRERAPAPPQRPYRSLIDSALRHNNGTRNSIDRRRPAPLPIRKHSSHIHGHGAQNRNSLTASMRSRAMHSPHANLSSKIGGPTSRKTSLFSALTSAAGAPSTPASSAAVQTRPKEGTTGLMAGSSPRTLPPSTETSSSSRARPRVFSSPSTPSPREPSISATSSLVRHPPSGLASQRPKSFPSSSIPASKQQELRPVRQPLLPAFALPAPLPRRPTKATSPILHPKFQHVSDVADRLISIEASSNSSRAAREEFGKNQGSPDHTDDQRTSIPRIMLHDAFDWEVNNDDTRPDDDDNDDNDDDKRKAANLESSSSNKTPLTPDTSAGHHTRNPSTPRSESIASSSWGERVGDQGKASKSLIHIAFDAGGNIDKKGPDADNRTEAGKSGSSSSNKTAPLKTDTSAGQHTRNPSTPRTESATSSSSGERVGDQGKASKSLIHIAFDAGGNIDKKSPDADNRTEAGNSGSSSSNKIVPLKTDTPAGQHTRNPSTSRGESVKSPGSGERAGDQIKPPRSMIHDIIIRQSDNNHNNTKPNGGGGGNRMAPPNSGSSSSSRTPLRPDATARRHLRETRATELVKLQMAGLGERERYQQAIHRVDQRLPPDSGDQNRRVVNCGDESQTRTSGRLKEKFRFLGDSKGRSSPVQGQSNRSRGGDERGDIRV